MHEPDTIPETYSRFPRTMGEAFRDAAWADPIERPSSYSRCAHDYPRSWWFMLWLCGVAALVLSWVLA